MRLIVNQNRKIRRWILIEETRGPTEMNWSFCPGLDMALSEWPGLLRAVAFLQGLGLSFSIFPLFHQFSRFYLEPFLSFIWAFGHQTLSHGNLFFFFLNLFFPLSSVSFFILSQKLFNFFFSQYKILSSEFSPYESQYPVYNSSLPSSSMQILVFFFFFLTPPSFLAQASVWFFWKFQKIWFIFSTFWLIGFSFGA